MRLSLRGAAALRHFGDPLDEDRGEDGEPPGVGEAVQLRLGTPREPQELGLPGLLPVPLLHCSSSRMRRSFRLFRRATLRDDPGGGDAIASSLCHSIGFCVHFILIGRTERRNENLATRRGITSNEQTTGRVGFRFSG